MSGNAPSNRQKWREGFQKSKMQKSIDYSRTSSLFEEETSDRELQEYLESLKKKSGIKRLWSGEKFDKTVRDDEDKTPDISISSSDNNSDIQDLHSMEEKDNDSDSDFRPNLVMFPDSPKEEQSDDSAELFNGIQLVDFPVSDDDDKQTLNNDTPSKSTSISEPKDIKNIMSLNNLNLASDIETEDEVAEEIDDDIDEILPSNRNKSPDSTPSNNVESVVHSSPELPHTPRESTPSGRRSRNRAKSQSKSLEHSYTMDFSTADEVSVIEEKTESSVSHSKNSSRSSSRSRSSRSRSSRSQSSRSEYSSKASNDSRSYHKTSHRSEAKKTKNSRQRNSHLCDASVQTGLDLEIPPAGLAVGMASVNQRLGMQYVNPSPIATHVVSQEALEAVTAYNPAVVALTDMLKQQVRLVEQFVDANNRMYQAYTANLNTGYRYTTLEDTLEFIKANRPKTISMKDALRQVKQEDS